MAIIKMTDLDLADKRVLIREDLNSPVKNGRVADDTRIRASLPTIEHALRARARVIVVSHLGRPEEGTFDEANSIKPVAERLGELLGREIPIVKDWAGGVEVAPGDLVLLENIRFYKGEKKNSDALAEQLAALCDIYVNDAFGTAHRAQASTHGIAKFAKAACAGPLLAAELEALERALAAPARPLIAIVGGSKVSTKLSVLETLVGIVDGLIVGGGIANTFLFAEGYNIGKSLAEPALLSETQAIIAAANKRGVALPIPVDVVCAKEFSESAEATLKSVAEIADDDMILDIGPRSSAALEQMIGEAGTIVWNGPVGVFEFERFGSGTRSLARAIAGAKAFSIGGGGDTLAAIAKYGIADEISYLSTGGGAFLEFLEGKKLPAVEILEQRAAREQ